MTELTLTPEQQKAGFIVIWYNETTDTNRVSWEAVKPNDSDAEVVEYCADVIKFTCKPQFAGVFAGGAGSLKCTFKDNGSLAKVEAI